MCELLEWRRPNGGLKVWEAKALLATLEARGQLALPALRTTRPRGSRTAIERSARGERRARIAGTLRDVAPVALRLVDSPEPRRLWRELIERYHYLGHRVPFGGKHSVTPVLPARN